MIEHAQRALALVDFIQPSQKLHLLEFQVKMTATLLLFVTTRQIVRRNSIIDHTLKCIDFLRDILHLKRALIMCGAGSRPLRAVTCHDIGLARQTSQKGVWRCILNNVFVVSRHPLLADRTLRDGDILLFCDGLEKIFNGVVA